MTIRVRSAVQSLYAKILPAAHCTEGGEASTWTGCVKITSWAPSSSNHFVQDLVKSANPAPAGKTALDSVWIRWQRSSTACMSSPTPGHLSFIPTDGKIRLCSRGCLHKDLQLAPQCRPASPPNYLPSSTVEDEEFHRALSRFPAFRCEEIRADHPAAQHLSSLLSGFQQLSYAMCHTPFTRLQTQVRLPNFLVDFLRELK